MGSLSTVFQAEVMATLKRTKFSCFRTKRSIYTYICSDSRAGIATLAKPPLNQLRESMQALEKLIRSKEVTLVWVSGHHAIPANEEAYKLAKEWANAVPSNQVSIPSVGGTEVIRYL
jgi:hypothetical protein